MSTERRKSIARAVRCGLTEEDASTVRRIALTLRRWFELECGDSDKYKSWGIERNESTGIPMMGIHPHTGQSTYYRVPDRENGARKRLGKIMSRYPNLTAYVQTDPRGGTIYLCKPEDATDSTYTRGVFIA